MSIEYCLRQPLHILLLAGGVFALSACTAMEETGELVESQQAFFDHPALSKLRVNDTFGNVWPDVVDIVEARGYEEIELDQAADRKTYTRRVPVEDRVGEKRLEETVTEQQGRIIATTEDGAVVPLELQEQHDWGVTTLGLIDTLLGGEGSWALDHDGVEITVASAEDGPLHSEELRIVFEQIREHFGG